MINNDVLRSLGYTLSISDTKMCEIAALGGASVTNTEMAAYLKREDEAGFVECPQNVMGRFLNGLIYFKRGRDETKPVLSPELPTNNVVLKKLRVAFELKDQDIISILNDVGFKISKAEVNALYRRENHANFRVCGDQLLRNFLKGLHDRELRKSSKGQNPHQLK
ncbi:MAG: DUF1456 family protein [Bdellovibrionales bacterium]|nr:DUF1456 family protein [Bdellovibrionales bacterium]